MGTLASSDYSNFNFIGERNYIHGSSILIFFIEYAKKNPDFIPLSEQIISFAVKQEITQKNGCWRPLKKIKSSDKKYIAATLKYIDSSKEEQGLAFINDGEPLQPKRLEEPPSVLSSIKSNGNFQGIAKLIAPITFADFIRGLIAANKKLHIETLQQLNKNFTGIRLIYIEKLPVWGVTQNISDQIQIDFRHLRSLDRKDRTYTLNQAIIHCGTKKITSTICYSY